MSTKPDKRSEFRSDSLKVDLSLQKYNTVDNPTSETGLHRDQLGTLENRDAVDTIIDKEEMEQEINPDKIDNENLIKKNFQLKEENIRLKCSFEAEKFSTNIIYGAKIESLEKELQQILYENHHLRQQMNKMKYMIGSLAKMIKKACKMYMGEREYPPASNEFFDSDSEYDFSDPKYFPIEELQDQIQQLLLDYREYISVFTEKRAKSISCRSSQKAYEGFQTKFSKHQRKKSEDYKLGYRRSSIK